MPSCLSVRKKLFSSVCVFAFTLLAVRFFFRTLSAPLCEMTEENFRGKPMVNVMLRIMRMNLCLATGMASFRGAELLI